MPKFGFSISAITAGMALIVLVLAGLALLFVLAAYSLAAAVVAIVPVIYVDVKREWDVTGEDISYVLTLLFAFFVSGAAAFAIDLVLETHVSAPAMIAALDLVQWTHARPEPLVQNMLDYYAVALGPTPWTWLRFLAVHAVMVVVFATVLCRTTPRPGAGAHAPAQAVRSHAGLERGGGRGVRGSRVPAPRPDHDLAARPPRLSPHSVESSPPSTSGMRHAECLKLLSARALQRLVRRRIALRVRLTSARALRRPIRLTLLHCHNQRICPSASDRWQKAAP